MHRDPVGIAAVPVPAGEGGGQAQVFLPRRQNRQDPQVPPSQATPTRSPRPEPGGAAAELHHFAHHFMARNDPGPAGREVAFGQMEIRAAHPADTDRKAAPRPGRGGDRGIHRQPADAAATGPGLPTRQARTAHFLFCLSGLAGGPGKQAVSLSAHQRVISTLQCALCSTAETVLPGSPSR